MINLKNYAVILLTCFSLLSSSLKAFSDEVGVVDVSKIFTTYNKAQKLTEDIKVKEAELRTFITNAQNEIKYAKTETDKKNLEDKYTKELKAKNLAFKNAKIEQLKSIETEILNAIKVTAESRNIKLLLNKDSLILGGVDITGDVIKILNSTANQ